MLCVLQRRQALLWILLLGVGAGAARMTMAIQGFPPVETRYNVEMAGHVDSDPYTNPDTGRVIMRFLTETVDGEASPLRLRLYLRGDAEALADIAYGQRLRLKGHIWANDPVTNPHEFDFGEYLHRNGMDAIATAKIEDVTIIEAPRGMGTILVDFKHAVERRIDALFPKSAAIVRALTLGDRSLISEELRESLNATGTAHLIAISGLHVSVLAILLSAALRLFMPRRRVGLVVLIPLLAYGALIGFPAPFTRALIMFSMVALSQAAGMPYDPVTSLCAALLGFVLVKPLCIEDGGFVLSFSASAGIILLLPPLRALFRLDSLPKPSPKLPLWRRAARQVLVYFPELLCASLAAQLATLPAIIAFFGIQSVVSLPFNLVCVPLCMAGYLIAMAALPLSAVLYPLGALLAWVSDGLLSALMAITQYSVLLPMTSVRIGRYPVLLILAHAALIVAASGLCAMSIDRRKFLPVSLLIVAGLSSLLTWIACQPFKITFLDAGQADCAVVQSKGHVCVFDAGDTYTPVGDYLSATCLGVDAVFLSHPHQDHAGGLKDILECFKPGAIYVPKGWFDAEDVSKAVTEGIDSARAMGIPIIELSAGDAMNLSPAAVLTVHNPAGHVEAINDMSLLLRVECEGRSVLFTGDLTAEGEPAVIPDCDVLKVSHHGADNATSARFLQAASPKIAVISVGENSSGHPGELTLWRLNESGAEILRTDERGAIALTPIDGSWRVETFLEAVHELE